eukprot:CAMPEP_0176323192 /NCGR_PEP_ID=MMETSP0121_2-20121125/72260_1 /TAXON_ID=160619 /ORGANISM="Kryptoperidinium foliaceum, Strain CCMP 1326" /LENGTH=421 /DNA_ID=CAMNT_0017665703 /DNA_START=83 /DNA_END=1350 /DNA_ORIENTATION=+
MRLKGKPLRVHPAAVQGYEANFQHFSNTKTGKKQDPCFSPMFLKHGSSAADAPAVLSLAEELGGVGQPPLPRPGAGSFRDRQFQDQRQQQQQHHQLQHQQPQGSQQMHRRGGGGNVGGGGQSYRGHHTDPGNGMATAHLGSTGGAGYGLADPPSWRSRGDPCGNDRGFAHEASQPRRQGRQGNAGTRPQEGNFAGQMWQEDGYPMAASGQRYREHEAQQAHFAVDGSTAAEAGPMGGDQGWLGHQHPPSAMSSYAPLQDSQQQSQQQKRRLRGSGAQMQQQQLNQMMPTHQPQSGHHQLQYAQQQREALQQHQHRMQPQHLQGHPMQAAQPQEHRRGGAGLHSVPPGAMSTRPSATSAPSAAPLGASAPWGAPAATSRAPRARGSRWTAGREPRSLARAPGGYDEWRAALCGTRVCVCAKM